jgi:hypothetical protein
MSSREASYDEELYLMLFLLDRSKSSNHAINSADDGDFEGDANKATTCTWAVAKRLSLGPASTKEHSTLAQDAWIRICPITSRATQCNALFPNLVSLE